MENNSLSVNNKIEKINILNEMRANSMTLQEMRFLSIYLSKINARNTETRNVKFSFEDFRKIMELGRLNIESLKENTTRLLQKVVSVPNDRGGYTQFQLFSSIKVDKDDSGEWYVKINCHDEALPLFFNFKEKYFTFEIWNELRLKSSNQIRMYEVLKQHQKQKEYTFGLSELRGALGIKKTEYKRFDAFKIRVLEACKKAIEQNTDIKYEYELIKKGAKVIAIKFVITKNKDFADPLNLAEFLSDSELKNIDYLRRDTENFEEEKEEEETPPVFENEKLEFLAETCKFEFAENDMQVLFDLISQVSFDGSDNIDLARYGYLLRKYNEMNSRQPQKSRLGYLKTLIKLDLDF